ncbi:MAG: hypothetical protein V9E83_03725 [Baekduia sp.]
MAVTTRVGVSIVQAAAVDDALELALLGEDGCSAAAMIASRRSATPAWVRITSISATLAGVDAALGAGELGRRRVRTAAGATSSRGARA